MKSERKITSSEKKLFAVSGIVIALILGFGAWWQWVNAVPDVEIPAPKMPSPNAYDFYVKAGAAIIPANPAVDPIHDSKEVPESQWKTHYPIEKKEAWLRQNATALKLLRQGFRYPCRVPPQRSIYEIRLRQVTGFREIARMLAIKSRTYGERGNWEKAAQSSLDILRLGRDISQGAVIDSLTGAAINAIGLREAWRTVPRLEAKEARSIIKKLEKITESKVSYADILREEKYTGQSMLLESMRLNEWRAISFTDATGLKRLGELWQTTTTPRRVIFNNYTNYMDSLIALAYQPNITKAKWPAIPDDFYNQFALPVLENSYWVYARDEAGDSLLLVALALRAYKLEHNRYPQTLDELVPRYIKQVPVDPFGGGEELHYKLRGAEYSLYSIGSDGIDDDGRAIENTKISKEKRSRFLVKPESKGDMVAGIN